MKRTSSIIICKIFLLFATTFILTSPSYALSVSNHLITDDPKQGSGCTMPAAKTTFTPNDTRVYFWVGVENAMGLEMTSWKWFAPDNSLYTAVQSSVGFSGTGCMWSWIDIKGQPAASKPGTWKAELHVINQLVASDTFTVGTPQPPTCTYSYSAWGPCQPDGTQTRTVISSSPSGCTGTPVLSQTCTYVPPSLPAPVNLRFTLNGDVLTVEWDSVSGASGYKAGLGMQPGMYAAPADLGSTTRVGPISISGVPPGTYYIAVKAYNASQESAYSNEIAITYAPQPAALSAPKNLRFTLDGISLTVLWDAAAGAGGYKVAFGSTSGSYMGDADVGSITQVGPIDVGGVPPGTYYIAVKAYKGSQQSGYSNEIAVTLTGRAGEMTISPTNDPLKVSGVYTVNGASKPVQFSSTSEGNGKAKASYLLGDGSEELTVDLEGGDKGSITWKGMTIDGYGALTSQEAAVLQELVSGDLGTALALTPLDLGCLATDKDPAALAALLMPWQMVLKYAVANRAEKMQELARGSACSYYENLTGSKPGPGPVLLSNEDPVPYVYEYFPYDEIGAVEASSSPSSLLFAAALPVVEGKLFGACGSRCRGACGANCPATCTKKEEKACIKDDAGKNTGAFTLFNIYECGGHAGCEWHDDCFEECLRKYGCGTWGASTCMHNTVYGCDRMAASQFGLSNCVSWAQGGGPYDKKLLYKYADDTGEDPVLCPPGAAAVIDSVTPASSKLYIGKTGGKITLKGSGFGSTQGASTVSFNGVVASVSFWSDQEIWVTVPEDATSGDLIVTVNGADSSAMYFPIETVIDRVKQSSNGMLVWFKAMNTYSDKQTYMGGTSGANQYNEFVPITWTGDSLSYSFTQSDGVNTTYTRSADGTFSSDGKTILNLVFTEQEVHVYDSSTSTEIVKHLTIVNLPISTDTTSLADYKVTGSGVQQHIASFDSTTTFKTASKTTVVTYQSTDWSNPNNLVQVIFHHQ